MSVFIWFMPTVTFVAVFVVGVVVFDAWLPPERG